MKLRRELWASGIRGWRCHRVDLPGKPDLAFGKAKVAVFVDGAFWHGHPTKYWQGRTSPYWDKKISRNQERDREADRALAALGWSVVRIWDFELKADLAGVVARVTQAVAERRT